MQSSSSPTDAEPPPPGSTPQVRLDLLAGLVLLAIAGFFLAGAGEGTLDWVFPSTLSYGVGILGVVLVVRSGFGASQRVAVIPSVLRGKGGAVAVFVIIMVAYVALIRPVGFWPMSALMIFVTAAYLAPDRSRRSVAIAAAAALAVILLGYVVLEYVFYVPFPEPRWLPF